MNVLLDCRYAFPHLSGIGRYVTSLVPALAALSDRPDKISVLVGKGDPIGDLIGDCAAVEVVEVSYSPRQLLSPWKLGGLLKKLGTEVFHAPDAFGPFRPPCATVITIHDLIPLACGTGGLKSRLGPVWKYWQVAQCRAASFVLTPSENSAKDISRYLGTPAEKVRVIHPGLRIPPAVSDQAKAAVLPRLGLKDRAFLLYVGRRDPYKNVVGCVEAFALLAGKHPGLKLVVAGHADPRFPEAEQAAARLGLGDRVVFTGHLADSDVDTLYASAAVTMLLSRYEGFGYPVVESMLRGTPVVCTGLTSLPEVAGDAVLYASPDSPAEAAARVEQILSSSALREDLMARGMENVARFSIERQARLTLDCYRDALRARRR